MKHMKLFLLSLIFSNFSFGTTDFQLPASWDIYIEDSLIFQAPYKDEISNLDDEKDIMQYLSYIDDDIIYPTFSEKKNFTLQTVKPITTSQRSRTTTSSTTTSRTIISRTTTSRSTTSRTTTSRATTSRSTTPPSIPKYSEYLFINSTKDPFGVIPNEKIDNAKNFESVDRYKTSTEYVSDTLIALLKSPILINSNSNTRKVNETPIEFNNTCGQKKLDHISLTANGFLTKRGDWPWHAALNKIFSENGTQIYICGGSLVSPTIVITAGYCVVENKDKITPEKLIVYLGRHYLIGDDQSVQSSNISDIALHPNFNLTSLKNNIAILKLSTAVTYTEYVQPICLWKNMGDLRENKLFNKTGVIVGWGSIESEKFSNKLQSAFISMIDDRVCFESNREFFSIFLHAKSYCAGFANGTSPCSGDSGSGMYFSKILNGQEYWFLRGIVSTISTKDKESVCNPNTYAVFTDVAKYLIFIKKQIPSTEIHEVV